ncbi:hypothetical protein COX95_02795 [bacterium CG_4_10_14_0_2_um_filter_33_32]|nr:MAG: hypothetical protein AUJ93_01040 [bacterium CG2_30_33_46]PIR67459.1 MAG: hypothetical protein COU50_03170 [bacterium CG10_big_fil_rev_8_21_14_0_10_33_18]PIU76379.1 MAG: hypothetical protein COS74_04350 [bacterium CG06_land_8_20_14_3_00_33_50]PIW81265.1 MAG: hypothetical protein COZ97_02695 [bacterium CG_4_8_14_3_um_filter_33_28]PIY85688.1 MAG: hypothetical protein COY76_00875 [bacterium CG_4_10_14_0_8_um_filter_33_57]PIZ85836.1 MAG: hypothetical protein COX95_02795 [bacterium CG_4_10_1
MNSYNIKKSILETISYFDIFDYPLTTEEITNYLWKSPASLDSVRKNIRKMIGNELGRKGEFYFLRNRDEIVKARRERQIISAGKWKKAKRIVGILRIIPFIRGIAVTQSLAINNAKEDSDIDLLIITSPKRIWIARAFTNLLLDLFRKRRPKNKNRICPNFLIVSNKSNIKSVSIEPQDIYLAYWINTTSFLFGKKAARDFINFNSWILELLPNRKTNSVNGLKPNPFYKMTQKILEFILYPFAGKFEKFVKEKQLKIIDKNKKTAKNPSIISSDEIIKIHYDDKRGYYLHEWESRIEKFQSTRA